MKVTSNRYESFDDKFAVVLNATPTNLCPHDDLYNLSGQEAVLLNNLREDAFEEISNERYNGAKINRTDSESKGSLKDGGLDPGCTISESGKTERSYEFQELDSNISENSLEVQDHFVNKHHARKINNKTVNKSNNLSAQVKKGLCVRNQMQMLENLLEIRIQLQKSLISANKMPQKQSFTIIKKNSGKEFSDQLTITKHSIATVLDKLLLLQKITLDKYPETRNLDQEEGDKAPNDDEEILSDDDVYPENIEKDKESEVVPNKKRKLNDFAEEISGRYNKYKYYRNSVIQKWNEQTKMTAIKNMKSNGFSVLNHIEHILSDTAKLIKRSQLKRSEYTILGQGIVENKDDEKKTDEEREYNTEIFDDDDFYHQLLRDLIEVKSAGLTDTVQLSRQWIQLQNLRSKMKRKIDTRATKGRKIRYAVHTKLVNFVTPIDNNPWTGETKNELFNSIFPKLQ